MQSSTVYDYQYVESFQCLADACPETCCSWQIPVPEERYQHYHENHPDLIPLINVTPDGYFMKRTIRHCAAIEDGICIIHRDKGEDQLTDTCINYPRLYRNFNDFYSRSATLSCPGIAKKVLFDRHPFKIKSSSLPSNHQDGKGISPMQLDTLDKRLWKQIMESILALTLDNTLDTEATLLRLFALIPMLEEADASAWPEVIAKHQRNYSASSKAKQVMPDQERQENQSRLLYILLSHMNNSTLERQERRRLAAAIAMKDRPIPQEPLAFLKPEYKTYLQEHSPAWVHPLLKRLIAAEITRIGFPFLSQTPAGQDYGITLMQWIITLSIRFLNLYLLVALPSADALAKTQLKPDKEKITQLVYKLSRQLNHLPTSPIEMSLRQSVERYGLDALWSVISV